MSTGQYKSHHAYDRAAQKPMQQSCCRVPALQSADAAYVLCTSECKGPRLTLSLRGAAPAMALYTWVRKTSKSCCDADNMLCSVCSNSSSDT